MLDAYILQSKTRPILYNLCDMFRVQDSNISVISLVFLDTER